MVARSAARSNIVVVAASAARRRWGRRLSFDRRVKAGASHGINHLLDRHVFGIERNDRFLRTKAHVRSTHALQPFQGLLDRDGSGTSRHPLDRENDRRSRREGRVRYEPETEQKDQNGPRAPHRITPMSWPV